MNPGIVWQWIENHVILAAFLGLLLLVRYLFCRRNMAEERCRLWYLYLAALLFPFLPVQRLSGWYPWQEFLGGQAGGPGGATSIGGVEAAGGLSDDYAVSVRSGGLPDWDRVVFALWIAGLAVSLALVCREQLRLHKILASAREVRDGKMREMFSCCRRQTGAERRVLLVSSSQVKSPFTAGLLRPKVLLPEGLERKIGQEDLKYVLLHELEHCAHRDLLTLFCMGIFRVLYWYQPLVKWGLKQFRRDMETACDARVLKQLPEEAGMEYGYTLLKLAERFNGNILQAAADWGGPAKQIRERTLQIAGYRRKSRADKRKGCLMLLFLTACLAAALPWLADGETAAAGPEVPGKISGVIQEEKQWEDAFEGQEGSFVLYHLQSGQCQVYNQALGRTRVSPDSTYKIYSALLALEEGHISGDNSLRRWDGTEQPFARWERDQDLNSAMADSVNWYFQRLDGQAGMVRLEEFLQELGYGNQDLSGGVQSSWLESSLKISPLEQAALLGMVFSREAEIQPEHVRTLKNALCLQKNGELALYGKTGTGRVDGKDIRGWFAGMLEAGEEQIVFVSYIQGRDGCTGGQAAEIAERILQEEGFAVSLDDV